MRLPIAAAGLLVVCLGFASFGTALQAGVPDAASIASSAALPGAFPPNPLAEAAGEPAALPALTGAANVVGRAATAVQKGPLGAGELRALAQEQQLIATVQGAPPLGWELRRQLPPIPPLPTASLAPPSPASQLLGQQAPVAAIAAVGIAALSAVGLPTLPFGSFYSRIEREEAMLNRRRNDLYELVRAEPGIHLSDLVRRCGLGWGAALYHLGVLEKSRVLVAHAEGGFKRYYANGAHGRAEMVRFAALRHDSARVLLEAVQSQPGRSGRELSQSLRLSSSSLARATGRLEGAGLLRRERAGRRVLYFPTEGVAETGQVAAVA